MLNKVRRYSTKKNVATPWKMHVVKRREESRQRSSNIAEARMQEALEWIGGLCEGWSTWKDMKHYRITSLKPSEKSPV